jgi:uncharacterized membrane protein YkoI
MQFLMPKVAVTFCGLAAANLSLANEPAAPQCFSTAQTREQIILHKLAEPFASMQTAARNAQGEPIGARLCRVDEAFVYEVSLLRRDGRLIKIFIDAATGKPHARGEDR